MFPVPASPAPARSRALCRTTPSPASDPPSPPPTAPCAPFSQGMGWHDRIVYFRDFAYPARRARMASGNISDVPAATFAEYVLTSFPELHHRGDCDASEHSSDESGDDLDGSPSSADACDASSAHTPLPPPSAATRCLPVRPVLAHRLNSHRLHVRAKAKLQRDRLLSGPMLDVYVGPARRHWALHRNLLCHHSELLENELHGDGKKQHNRLELPDHDPAGFELLVKWLYQGKLDDVTDMADANQKYDYAVSCHKLYLLCDRFDMPQLKNVAMDQYRKGLNQAELVPDADEIDAIYRQSPVASPFRRLMTRIAARQIMDPNSDRDVETYRQCFEGNSDFAIEMVKAIKDGAGGTLFDDPTDTGNECEYHDHEAGPNCHIKGKGRGNQALKASALRSDPKYAKFAPSKSSDLPNLPRRQTPLLLSPPPPPRHARRQDGASNAGPLRRRITSPASSTVEMSTEHATASHPSPTEPRDKLRRTPPRKHLQSPDPALPEALTEESHPVPADLLPNSSDTSLPPQTSSASDVASTPPSKTNATETKEDPTSPSRRIWGWAKAGTGRLGIIGRLPHPEWKGPVMTTKAATTAMNGVLEGAKTGESLDDFSIPASTSTEPDNAVLSEEVAAAKVEGLGIANSTVDPMFSQTKRSSDELAASVTETPSPHAMKDEQWTNGVDSMMSGTDSPPATPSPAQRPGKLTNGTEDTPSPRRIPTYKIALAANILAPHRTVST